MTQNGTQGPVIASKVKYLGSCLLPSPIGLEVTLLLYRDRIEIPQLDAAMPLDRIKTRVVEGKDLPPETTTMFGVVGATVDKDRPYLIIEVGGDSMLLKFEDVAIASKLLHELKKVEKNP
jgi:hypothetical protein